MAFSPQIHDVAVTLPTIRKFRTHFRSHFAVGGPELTPMQLIDIEGRDFSGREEFADISAERRRFDTIRSMPHHHIRDRAPVRQRFRVEV